MTPGIGTDPPAGMPHIQMPVGQKCAYCGEHVEKPCSHDQYERCENYQHGDSDEERRH